MRWRSRASRSRQQRRNSSRRRRSLLAKGDACMAERIDWDKRRRQNVVLRQGSEPSEFPDITKQIAKAKGFAKVRGPMLRACTGCGQYYDEHAPEEHVCRPRPKSKKVRCRKCGEELD